MTQIPLQHSDWRRDTGNEPIIKVQNRFFEKNPSNFVEGASALIRPGFRQWVNLGSSPTCSLYCQDGTFGNHLFAVTQTGVYVLDSSGTPTELTVPGTFTTSSTATNTLAISNAIGDIAPSAYVCGDNDLWVASELPTALGTLTASASVNIAANDVVVIGSMYYKFVVTNPNDNTENGMSGHPFTVVIGANNSATLQNLGDAVNAVGNSANYSVVIQKNPLANLDYVSGNSAYFYSTSGGSSGNSTVSTTTSAALSWGAGTFLGGADSGAFSTFRRVPSPNDPGNPTPTKVTFKNIIMTDSCMIAIANSPYSRSAGRWYFVNPGETWIDPLSYATIESNPDTVVSVRSIGTNVWFLGRETIEVWYPSGDPATPFQRIPGRVFNHGVIENSDCVVGNTLFFVDTNGRVFQTGEGGPTPISNNSIEAVLKNFIQGDNGSSLTLENIMRAWSFSIDGHTYYVLNVGTTITYVYDITTQYWTVWSNYNDTVLRQHNGCQAFFTINNTTSLGTFGLSYPIIAGDIRSGALWIMDPKYRYDDVYNEKTSSYPIECILTAGLPARMRDTFICNEVYMTGSVGDPSVQQFYIVDGDLGPEITDNSNLIYDVSGNTPEGNAILGINTSNISLLTSDDNGQTWQDQGDISVQVGNYTQEIAWRSLGIVTAPGRLFQLVDYGAIPRIDGLDMR